MEKLKRCHKIMKKKNPQKNEDSTIIPGLCILAPMIWKAGEEIQHTREINLMPNT